LIPDISALGCNDGAPHHSPQRCARQRNTAIQTRRTNGRWGLVRKTICFSKSTQLHDIVIGLFVNRYEFGIAV
jgi:IS1 transposase